MNHELLVGSAADSAIYLTRFGTFYTEKAGTWPTLEQARTACETRGLERPERGGDRDRVAPIPAGHAAYAHPHRGTWAELEEVVLRGWNQTSGGFLITRPDKTKATVDRVFILTPEEVERYKALVVALDSTMRDPGGSDQYQVHERTVTSEED